MKKRIFYGIFILLAAIGLFQWSQGVKFRTLPFDHLKGQMPDGSSIPLSFDLTREESQKIIDNLARVGEWKKLYMGSSVAQFANSAPPDPCGYLSTSYFVVYANDPKPLTRGLSLSVYRSTKPDCPEKTNLQWGNLFPDRCSDSPEDAPYRAEILKIIESAKARDSKPAN